MPKKGYRITEEHRNSLKLAALGRKHSKETKEKIALKLMGTRASAKARKLMKKREETKRVLFRKVLEHLEKQHPKFHRIECRGYRMWRLCPVCEKEI